MKYGRGHLSGSPPRGERPFQDHPLAGGAATTAKIPSTALLSLAPLGRDQGISECCWAVAPDSCAATFLGTLTGTPAAPGSWIALAMLGKAEAGLALNTTEGGFPEAAHAVLRQVGIVPEDALRAALDADGNLTNQPADLASLPPMSAFVRLGAEVDTFRLDTAVDVVGTCRAWLAPHDGAHYGLPFSIAFQVGDAFQALSADQPWQGRDTNTGGHDVLGLADLGPYLLCANQWGPAWGGATAGGRLWPGCFIVPWGVVASEASSILGVDRRLA